MKEQNSKGNSPKRRRLLGVAISGSAVLLLAVAVDWHQTLLRLSDAHPFKLLAGSLAIFVSYFIFGWRWHLLLKERSAVSFWVSFRSLAIGHFFNAFLPLRAGDLVRIHSLKRHLKKDSAYILGAIVFEKLLDVSILLLMFIGIIAVQRSTVSETVIFLSLLLIAAIGFAIAAVRRLEFFPVQNRTVLANSPTMAIFLVFVARKIDALVGFFRDIPITSSHLFPIVLASILSWATFLSGYIFCLEAFDVPEAFVGAIAIVSATNLGAVIPSSPAGIGVYEGLCLTALYPFGVALPVATAIAIVTHIIAISAQVSLGGISLAIEHSSTIS